MGIGDIAPSWSNQIEANREAMLGDCDAIEATLNKDDALWSKAAGHYEAARALHKEVRARVTNNLGWIALKIGTPETADALFRESAEDETSGRRWLGFLNALAGSRQQVGNDGGFCRRDEADHPISSKEKRKVHSAEMVANGHGRKASC